MDFINDKDVIGKWEHFSVISSKEEFEFKSPNPLNDKAFKEIYFLENGQKYWIFEGWTKGYLFIHYGGDEPLLCYKYSIHKVNSEMFLFIEITGDNSYICVLKKTSNKHFEISEIGQRDNIDLCFVEDNDILGEWYSIAFIDDIDSFSSDCISDELWLNQITFNSNGTVVRIYNDEIWEDKWTKGFLLDSKKSTASAYILKTINKKQYLFVEWKMGNYVYGGAKPSYYVFSK